MKKAISFLLSLVLICVFAVPVMAATEPEITRQPQNPTYIEYSLAEYSVTVYGKNLKCTWYMSFDGKEYNICDTESGVKPWEPYAGETYGPTKDVNGDFTTFTYTFAGIGKELNGSYIYAAIEDGHFDITSDKAYITVVDDCGTPPKTSVAADMEIYQNDVLDLYCEATAQDGSKLSYLWYETSTGKLENIIAINRGSETNDTLHCDTSTCGTRYYVCAVTTSEGGSTYTNVIPVTVIAKPISDTPSEPSVTDKPTEPGESSKPTDSTETPTDSTESSTETSKDTENTDSMETPADSTESSTEASKDTENTDSTTDTTGNNNEQNPQGMPWWGILLIAVAAAGAGVGITVIVLNKKK